MQTKTIQSGFALLLTLIVVSIVLAIGLSILNVTLKQFTLSSIARDSEIAFHAANAGLECMQHHRHVPSTRDDLLDGGSAPALQCAGVDPEYTETNHESLSGNRQVYNYVYRYDIAEGRCFEMSMYLLDTQSGSDIEDYSVDEGFETISCTEGVVCTTIFSRGFNRSCDDVGSIRTVQRELTIQF